MKIELIGPQEADLAMHGHHREMWVRVLGDDPLEPADWASVIRPLVKDDIDPLKFSVTTPCAFYSDMREDDDPERADHKFEHWWILPEMRFQRPVGAGA